MQQQDSALSSPASDNQAQQTNQQQAQANQQQQNNNAPVSGEQSGKQDNETAWKDSLGKQVWLINAANITESGKRKWHHAQTKLKTNSQYIVRFVANCLDGGFAIDDISFYDGSCETRPSFAKVKVDNELDEEQNSSPSSPQTNNQDNQNMAKQPKIAKSKR